MHARLRSPRHRHDFTAREGRRLRPHLSERVLAGDGRFGVERRAQPAVGTIERPERRVEEGEVWGGLEALEGVVEEEGVLGAVAHVVAASVGAAHTTRRRQQRRGVCEESCVGSREGRVQRSDRSIFG